VTLQVESRLCVRSRVLHSCAAAHAAGMLTSLLRQVGGPATAAGMAAAKGWTLSLVPALLMGTLGYSIATFAALALGRGVLLRM
jgi:uncharacterized membrane protein